MEKVKAAKESTSSSGGSSSGLKSEGIFNLMNVFLARGEGKTQVAQVQAVF